MSMMLFVDTETGKASVDHEIVKVRIFNNTEALHPMTTTIKRLHNQKPLYYPGVLMLGNSYPAFDSAHRIVGSGQAK